MFSNEIFKAHRAQILSCFSLGAGVWLTIWPIFLIFPSFQLILWSLPQCFEYDLDFPIPQLQVSLDVCAHIPLTLWVSTSYVVFITESCIGLDNCTHTRPTAARGSIVPTHYPPMRPSPYPLPTHLPMGMGGYWVPMGMGTHCRTLAHNNECIGTHDAIHDTFVAILWDVGFHVGWWE
jgi:hypothetical protein